MRNRTTLTPAAAAAPSFSRIARKNSPQRDAPAMTHDRQRAHQQYQSQIVVRAFGAPVEQRRHLEAAGATSDLVLRHDHDAQHLGERYGEQRKVRTAHAQADEADASCRRPRTSPHQQPCRTGLARRTSSPAGPTYRHRAKRTPCGRTRTAPHSRPAMPSLRRRSRRTSPARRPKANKRSPVNGNASASAAATTALLTLLHRDMRAAEQAGGADQQHQHQHQQAERLGVGEAAARIRKQRDEHALETADQQPGDDRCRRPSPCRRG